MSRSGIGLWVVQSLLALTFVGTGFWKLVTPMRCPPGVRDRLPRSLRPIPTSRQKLVRSGRQRAPLCRRGLPWQFRCERWMLRGDRVASRTQVNQGDSEGRAPAGGEAAAGEDDRQGATSAQGFFSERAWGQIK